MQYEGANGDEIQNLVEKLFAVITEEGAVRGMRPKVAEVSNAHQSVRALVKTWHLVVFGEGENGEDNHIVNRTTGEMNTVRNGATDHKTAEPT